MSSDDLEGLRLLGERGPAVTAGEYGYADFAAATMRALGESSSVSIPVAFGQGGPQVAGTLLAPVAQRDSAPASSPMSGQHVLHIGERERTLEQSGWSSR